MASVLQQFQEEVVYLLEPFQSGFRLGYEMETALFALVDDLYWKLDRVSVSLLVLLDISVAFYFH